MSASLYKNFMVPVKLTLLFLNFAGRPQPDVSWFMNGNLVDDEYEHNSGNIIENRLLWPSLQRHDLYSVFTCRAANTKAVAPRDKRLVLDMYRKCRCRRCRTSCVYSCPPDDINNIVIIILLFFLSRPSPPSARTPPSIFARPRTQ